MIIRPANAPSKQDDARIIGFLFVPNFSMIAFTSAIEPLRLANQLSERKLYDWRLLSKDGEPVKASNGVTVTVDHSFQNKPNLDMALVCAGVGVQTFDHGSVIAALRRLASAGADLGAVCTGSYVLAKAGLLDGYRSTIHWENHAGFVEEFPRLKVSQELFEIDRTRFTCAGGTSALDMMLSVIARNHGARLAADVSDQLIHHRIRDASEAQRMNVRQRLNVAHPKLLTAVQLMEREIEQPLSCQAVAERVVLSSRQLERLFLKYLGCSPTRHYLKLRLDHARHLLRQTSMPVLSVALACGFSSASHFAECYHRQFHCTPSADRRSLLAAR